MDTYDMLDFTFMDLSDEDEETRKEISQSLRARNPSVQLPWKVVPRTKCTNKNEISTNNPCHINDGGQQNQHQQIVPSNQIDYNTYLMNQPPEQFSHPSNNPSMYSTAGVAAINYQLQPQYIIYSPTLPYPVSPVEPTGNYHQQVLPQQQLVNTNYNKSVQFNAPNSVQEFVPANYNPSNNVSTKKQVPENVTKFDKNANNTTKPVENIKQNGEEPKGKIPPAPKSKTWASLLYGNEANGVSNGNGTNNDVMKSNEAVNEETNNNEDCPIRNPRRDQYIDPNSYRMGEHLLKHNVEGRTISLQPRGLINRSNYCYVNSILQALLACPPLYNLLSELSKQYIASDAKKETPVIDAMCRFIKEFKHLPAGQRVKRRNDKNVKKEQSLSIDCDLPFEAYWMYRMLNGTRSDSFLVEGRQEDAEEFLGCLLNGLNDEMLELMKLVNENLNVKIVDKEEAAAAANAGYHQDLDKEWQVMGPKNKGSITRQVEYIKTPISNIFGGALKSRIHRTGDHSTSNIQPFFTLQLNIKKVKTVNEALEALVLKNQLEGVTSVNTNEEVEAWQQVTLEELPVILILHLKCFDFKLNGCTKIVKALEFPIDLKIDSKLLSSQPTTPKEKQYKLFAVVYHDGREATKGHYVTDAFHVGYSSWIRYDDAAVKPVQEDQVLKPQGSRVPYLLFYRRSDKIRSK